MHDGGNDRLADSVSVREAAHAVGDDREDAVGLQRIRGNGEAVLLALPRALRVDLADRDAADRAGPHGCLREAGCPGQQRRADRVALGLRSSSFFAASAPQPDVHALCRSHQRRRKECDQPACTALFGLFGFVRFAQFVKYVQYVLRIVGLRFFIHRVWRRVRCRVRCRFRCRLRRRVWCRLRHRVWCRVRCWVWRWLRCRVRCRVRRLVWRRVWCRVRCWVWCRVRRIGSPCLYGVSSDIDDPRQGCWYIRRLICPV